MSVFVNKNTKVICQGITGTQASFHIHTNYPLSQGHLQTQVSLTIEGNINLKKAQESKSL